ncbi:MAG: hypothetical protein AB7W16_14230 [Candidatus Obscuribacterales bacterium]
MPSHHNTAQKKLSLVAILICSSIAYLAMTGPGLLTFTLIRVLGDFGFFIAMVLWAGFTTLTAIELAGIFGTRLTKVWNILALCALFFIESLFVYIDLLKPTANRYILDGLLAVFSLSLAVTVLGQFKSKRRILFLNIAMAGTSILLAMTIIRNL